MTNLYDHVAYGSYRYLELLDLTNSRIETINSETFQKLEYLRYLFLDRNKIKSFEPGTFKSLNIRHIDFSYNYIRRLNSNSFGSNTYLSSFNLANNKIEQIESDFFDNFKAKREILASGNLCINAEFYSYKFQNLNDTLTECHQNWIKSQTTTMKPTSSAMSVRNVYFLMSMILIFKPWGGKIKN